MGTSIARELTCDSRESLVLWSASAMETRYKHRPYEPERPGKELISTLSMLLFIEKNYQPDS